VIAAIAPPDRFATALLLDTTKSSCEGAAIRLLSSVALAFLGLFLSTHTPLTARAQDVSHAEGSQAPSHAARSQAARSHGTIAYTNSREIRLIESDGSDDRVVWMVPDTAYAVSRLAWSPDGEEIAFASDHEMATSFYERDIYGIRPDGTGLRKLTNPPIYQELASYEKGTVTVAVSNFSGDGGPFFVYVSGAAAPQPRTLWRRRTLLAHGRLANRFFSDRRCGRNFNLHPRTNTRAATLRILFGSDF